MKKNYLAPELTCVDITSESFCLETSSPSPSPTENAVSLDYEEGVWEGDVKAQQPRPGLWD